MKVRWPSPWSGPLQCVALTPTLIAVAQEGLMNISTISNNQFLLHLFTLRRKEVYFYQHIHLSRVVYQWMMCLFVASDRSDPDHLRFSYRTDEPLIAAITGPTVLYYTQLSRVVYSWLPFVLTTITSGSRIARMNL